MPCEKEVILKKSLTLFQKLYCFSNLFIYFGLFNIFFVCLFNIFVKMIPDDQKKVNQ